jgi:hypothetical protein
MAGVVGSARYSASVSAAADATFTLGDRVGSIARQRRKSSNCSVPPSMSRLSRRFAIDAVPERLPSVAISTRDGETDNPRSLSVNTVSLVLYGQDVKIERHWWNGDRSPRGRRDVYIRTDGQRWEVEAQTGGHSGRSKVHQCPSPASAAILADAWLGGRPEWRELAV